MTRLRSGGLIFTLLLLTVDRVTADSGIPLEASAPRGLRLTDLEVEQEPAPPVVRGAPTPPNPSPSPPQARPETRPAPNATVPLTPTPRPAPTPAPAPAPAPTGVPSPMLGADSTSTAIPPTFASPAPNLFGGSAEAQAALAGFQPRQTLEMFGDTLGASRLFRVSGFAANDGDVGALETRPPVPKPPPPVPGPFPPPNPPPSGERRRGFVLAPSARIFKIAENQSPRPLDRVYYYFNFFDNVNERVNQRFGIPIREMDVYRHVLGFEKTYFDGKASFGMQLPLNTLSVDGAQNSLSRTSTALGDLALIFKSIIAEEESTGSLISAGLALTVPSGSSRFAGSNSVFNPRHTVLNPFVGFILNRGRFYVQGFSSINVPVNNEDVTFFFNDIGVGYFLVRNESPDAWITAIAPTFEVHVNTPLNHRGFSIDDPAGSVDVVDLTYGVNTIFRNRTRLGLGLATPVTGPKPFDLEVQAQLSVRF